MMKKFVVFLAICLCVSLAVAIPAGAADTTFSDVPQDAWYASAVELCVERGLLSGTGDGKFSPDSSLRPSELVVIAARLHSILQGGSGALEPAPAQYRTMTFTKADGTPAPFQLDDINGVGQGGSFCGFTLRSEDFKLQEGERYTVKLVLDKTYEFSAKVTLEEGNDTPWLRIDLPQAGITESGWVWDQYFLCDTALTIPQWVMPAVYYFDTHHLPQLSTPAAWNTLAKRYLVAEMFCRVVPQQTLQPRINEIWEVPDLSAQAMGPANRGATDPADFLAFYQAGIVTGGDAYGSWYGYRTLKRSEIAAMLARILEPSLRQKVTLQTPDYLDYELTPAPAALAARLGEAEPYGEINGLFGDRAIVKGEFYDNQGKVFTPAMDDPIRVFATLRSTFNMSANSVTHGKGYHMTLREPIWEGYAPVVNEHFAGEGLARADGTLVIPPRFVRVGNLADGKALVQKSDGSWWVLTV